MWNFLGLIQSINSENPIESGHAFRRYFSHSFKNIFFFTFSQVIHFSHLPQWLQDNDFLHFGHRPPLPTSECFKSIIRIHTETGNIWTHLLGMNYSTELVGNKTKLGKFLSHVWPFLKKVVHSILDSSVITRNWIQFKTKPPLPS